MLNHNVIAPSENSRKTSKRLWRWNGSGKGTFCGKGCKWQNARSGSKYYPTFEWGQTPIFRRMPKKRWFTANNELNFSIINISTLDKLITSGVTVIDRKVLEENSLVKRDFLIKLLWNGEIKAKVEIQVNKASAWAIQKIEKAGWKVEIIAIQKIEKASSKIK